MNNDEEYDMIVLCKKKNRKENRIINDIVWISYPKERIVFNTKENKSEAV